MVDNLYLYIPNFNFPLMSPRLKVKATLSLSLTLTWGVHPGDYLIMLSFFLFPEHQSTGVGQAFGISGKLTPFTTGNVGHITAC